MAEKVIESISLFNKTTGETLNTWGYTLSDEEVDEIRSNSVIKNGSRIKNVHTFTDDETPRKTCEKCASSMRRLILDGNFHIENLGGELCADYGYICTNCGHVEMHFNSNLFKDDLNKVETSCDNGGKQHGQSETDDGLR